MRKHLRFAALAPLVAVVGWYALRPGVIGAADEPRPAAQGRDEHPAPKGPRNRDAWTTAVEPKALSPNAKNGLGWLAEHQLKSGGWGQGEESVQMGGGNALRDTANVADTCVAALALIRSGSTPRQGPYRDAVAKAVAFVRGQIDASDSQSLAVSQVQGTRVQQKLGPNIDTFLASMLLAEVKGQMPDDSGERAVVAALDKVLGKIQRHQKADGSFEGNGWAPILAQAMCGKGINRARQNGVAVPDVVLANAENSARLAFAESARPAAAAPGVAAGEGGMIAYRGASLSGSASTRGAAGVELYARAASVGVLQDSVNTVSTQKKDLRDEAKNGKDEKTRSEARQRLAQIAESEKVNFQAQAAVIDRLGDKQFVAGFGSNGGEEFLSYMTLAESLVLKGGDAWRKWDAQMTENLNRVQNGDGSWSGHHCITGRTFCTSTALLVLMADRTPVPVQAKEDARGEAR